MNPLDPFRFLIDYVFPPTCLSCGEFTLESHSLCGGCWNKLNFIASPYCTVCGKQFDITLSENLSCGRCITHVPSYDIARSLLKFDKSSKKMIHAFKYHDQVEFSKLFSKLLCKTYRDEISVVDIVVPVPMHRIKRLLRMYNQADLLCKGIAKVIGKPRSPDALIKTKWTKSQVYLSKRARKDNLKNTIILNSKYDLSGKVVLLVDDVVTTGATLDYCSKLLKGAGAKSVIALTVAMA